MSSLFEVEACDLLEFAMKFASLGDSIQEQVEMVLIDAQTDEVNPDAIEVAHDRIGGYCEEIDAAFAEYFDFLEDAEKIEELENHPTSAELEGVEVKS